MAVKDDNIQVSVTLPKELVQEKVDPDAKKEMRSRSKQIAKIVLDHYNYADQEN